MMKTIENIFFSMIMDFSWVFAGVVGHSAGYFLD
jgi:hypothetical protein